MANDNTGIMLLRHGDAEFMLNTSPLNVTGFLRWRRIGLPHLGRGAPSSRGLDRDRDPISLTGRSLGLTPKKTERKGFGSRHFHPVPAAPCDTTESDCGYCDSISLIGYPVGTLAGIANPDCGYCDSIS